MIPQDKNNGVTPELRALSTADPVTELRKAIHKHNLSFLGIAGYNIAVPGVPVGGGTNPIVDIRGVHVIEGTSDNLRTEEQQRSQSIATKYAERYNRLLFTYLIRHNDPSVSEARHKIDGELARMERSDPIADAKKIVQKAPPLLFIALAEDNVPGIDTKTFRSAEQEDNKGRISYQTGAFAFVPEVMTFSQRSRLARQISRYAIPYNRYVFAHYLTHKKARQ